MQTHPPERAPHSAPGVPWKLVVGAWTAYGLLGAVQQEVWASMSGRRVSVWSGLALQLPQAWCWAALTPAVLWLGRRLPLRGPGWPFRVMAHMLIATAIVFLIGTFFD